MGPWEIGGAGAVAGVVGADADLDLGVGEDKAPVEGMGEAIVDG